MQEMLFGEVRALMSGSVPIQLQRIILRMKIMKCSLKELRNGIVNPMKMLLVNPRREKCHRIRFIDR
jgi:hypothetical protein